MNARRDFTDISVPIALEKGYGISDIGSHIHLFEEISAFVMDPTTDIPKMLASVIQLVSAIKSGLDEVTKGAEDGDLTLTFRRDLNAGLGTTLLTLHLLEVAAKLQNTSITVTAPQAEVVPAQPEKPKFEVGECRRCGFLFGLYAQHQCVPGKNRFTIEDLNALFGPDGWFEVEIAPSGHEQPPGATEHPIPRGSEQTPPIAEVEPLGMREGSKKHRAYVATTELLEQHGPMHIDDMLESVSALGVFAGVKNRRARYANLLSQFKGKGLLDSDNRGNWSLPYGRGGRIG